MKKLLLISAGFYLLMLSASQTVKAQSIAMVSAKTVISAPYSRANYEINAKSVRNFTRNYKGVENPQWSVLENGSSICTFLSDGIRYRVYYSKKGKWLHTISGYEESKLPREVRSLVKGSYYDYSIFYVNEVLIPGGKTVYLVQIQGEKDLKILRITEDGMETIQEMTKL
jgi:hypothetical protein